MGKVEGKRNNQYIKAKEKIAALFKNKKSLSNDDSRLPPGQHIVTNFPILDLGIKPDFDPATWKLHIHGLVENELYFSYQDILAMPKTGMTKDFHCVTKWSQYDVEWAGVLWKDFVQRIHPKPTWVACIQEAADGYTTNVLREDMEREDVLLAYELQGKPIPREHGWPMRIIIPHLYGWKSAKFLHGLKFSDKDELGFWEQRGYHKRGNVREEERYS